MHAAAFASGKIFVGGLSAQTTTEMLRANFAKYGYIVDCVVMSQNGRPRGFGFVTFDQPASALAALAEPQWLGDRFVDVKTAVPGDQSGERPPNPNKIFVGGLPQEFTTEDLRAHFAQYGPIADAVVMVDRRTKRSRGFGFILFANGAHGARAAEAVLQGGASRWLGGKMVELKRATPQHLLQESTPHSPGSITSTSPTHTPAQQHHQHQLHQLHQLQQQQQEDNILAPWLCTPPDSAANAGLLYRDRLRQKGRMSMGGAAMSDTCSMYANQWNSMALAEGMHSFGMGAWMSPAEQVSSASPSTCRWPELAPAVVLGLTPSTTAATPAHGFDGSTCEGSPASSSHSDAGSDEENRPPPAANRAVTPPPPARKMRQNGLTPPPGLAMDFMASPMKIECRSDCFEGLTMEDGLLKVLPTQHAC